MSEDIKAPDQPETKVVDLVPKKNIKEFLSSEFYQKLRSRPHINGDDVELYDPDTNKVYVILHRYMDHEEMATYLFDEIRTPWGPVYLDEKSRARGINNERSLQIAYSQKWSDLLCHYIMEGRRLRDIAKLPNMPNYQAIHMWRKQFPEFDQKLLVAYEARAEYERDEAHYQSELMLEDEDSSWQKRAKHVDHLMNFAAKDDPKRYSSKVEVHNTSPPMILRVETGVDYNKYRTVDGDGIKELTGEIADQLEAGPKDEQTDS